jgi:hypothetical protein
VHVVDTKLYPAAHTHWLCELAPGGEYMPPVVPAHGDEDVPPRQKEPSGQRAQAPPFGPKYPASHIHADAQILATAEEANRDGQSCGGFSPPVQKVFATHAVQSPPLSPWYPGPHTHAVSSVLCAGEYELARQFVRTSSVQNVFSRHLVHVSDAPYTYGVEQKANRQSDSR